jgi:hypothetical protein
MSGFFGLFGGGKKEPPQAVEEPWATARQLLADHDRNWAGRAAYNVVEPAFVDPILQRVIDRKRSLAGQMPSDLAAIKRIVRTAGTAYRSRLLSSEEGRAAVEARVQAYFADPPVEREGPLARCDHGRLPGPLSKVTRAGWGIARSDHEEEGELRPTTLAWALRRLHDLEPSANAWEIAVEVPFHSRVDRMRYRYERSRDRVVVFPGAKKTGVAYLSDRLHQDFASLTDGRVGGHTNQMDRVTAKDKVWEGRGDAPF